MKCFLPDFFIHEDMALAIIIELKCKVRGFVSRLVRARSVLLVVAVAVRVSAVLVGKLLVRVPGKRR
jgi:hypothetical protein